jgi:hypothetical protein
MTAPDSPSPTHTAWRVAYAGLTALFILTALLNLARVRAGFLTSHAADLVVPAWMYVTARGLAGTPAFRNPVSRWLGRTPLRAASVLFLASTATELSQKVWPRGLFPGTYDPWDLVAYGTGLAACVAAEALSAKPQAAPEG